MRKTHTDREYESQLRDLRERLLLMAGRVEEMIGNSVRSLIERDPELARRTIESDNKVNRAEVETDELCLVILAKRQPMASDLRFITLALKMVTDLERIGDLAVNICERAVDLAGLPGPGQNTANTANAANASGAARAGATGDAADAQVAEPARDPALSPWADISNMTAIVQSMVRDAIDAFITGDVDRARSVIERDNEVDELYTRVFRDILAIMTRDGSAVERGIHVQSVAKWLERMADHSTNLAEQVVFMVKGKDIRHLGKLDG